MTDLISRADAIGTVLTYFIPRSHTGERGEHEEDFVRMIFNALPSAETVQGEWVRKVKEYNDCDGHRVVYWYECDQCGARPPKDQWKNEWHSNYCPSCGAKMCKGGDSE